MKQYNMNTKFIIGLLLSCIVGAVYANDAVIHLANEEQYQDILNGSSSKPAVIKFAAEWCGACQSVKESFAQVASDPNNQNVNFVHVNIDNFQALAQKYSVTGIPTFLYVQNGSPVHQEVGVKNPATFKEAMQENINTHFGSKTTDVHPQGAEQEAMAAAHEHENAPIAHHESHEHMEVLAKIQSMAMMFFMKVKELLISIVNWIKGLFGR